MQYIWVESGPGEVPPGAVVAGKTADGRILYVAQTRGEAGHYDPTKHCAEDYNNCAGTWKILVVTYCEHILLEFSFPVQPTVTYVHGISNQIVISERSHECAPTMHSLS